MSVNRVVLVGRVGIYPEIREFEDGGAVVNLPLATNRSWRDRDTQERQEETEWHTLVFRNGLAKVVKEFVRKGSQLYIDGRLKTRKYTDSEGVDRYPTEIIVEEMTILGSRGDTAAAEPETEPEKTDKAGKAEKPVRRRSPRKNTAKK